MNDWEINLAGEWRKVGIAERSFLQGLQRRGESRGKVQLWGQEFDIDLVAMTQRNSSTGMTRPLRRCVVNKPTPRRSETLLRASSLFFPDSLTEPVEVTMNVYDVGLKVSVQTLNGVLHMLGNGAYHVAVQVYGLEWSFGSCEEDTGVFRSVPRECQDHHYRSSQVLGTVQKTRRDVEELLQAMSAEWQGEDYDLLHKNCCHFSDALSQKLGSGPLPSWVLSTASWICPRQWS